MSDTQVSLVGSGNKTIEQESTEETTLSEVSKDLGHTKISEKSAQFEATSNTSIVEENASKNIQSSCNVAQSVSQSVTENQPIKPFEPVKPFEPMKPFEPLKPFEPPKSFELTREAEKTILESEKNEKQETVEPEKSNEKEISTNKEINVETEENLYVFPPDYVPVEALEPLKPFEPLPPLEPHESSYSNVTVNGIGKNINESSPKAEIKEEKIKNSLKEIISDLDSYAEKDKELKESYREERKVDDNSTTYSYEKVLESQSHVKEITQEIKGGPNFQFQY
ncbi:hypothetical protein BDFB_004468 [Asbolus verrucosus]|uniref:Uncharacterized protein n=1 Tax=Asbolus verrucosus TaxID=1661398 RepID=A0A482VYA0_ASBVE|nr:hypothetical protein BDFB_004468 [Asbolus verrucosus]